MPKGVDDLDRRIAAGFDPTSGYFLAAAVTIRAAILVAAIDTNGNQVAVTQLDCNDPFGSRTQGSKVAERGCDVTSGRRGGIIDPHAPPSE